MQSTTRQEGRRPHGRSYSLSWKDGNGITRSAEVQATDVSDSGIAVRCPIEIQKDTIVYVQAEEHTVGYATVRHVVGKDAGYDIGLEFDENARKAQSKLGEPQECDHYEFLQISPKAQPETIHRVYRFLAARLHPDNPETGDPNQFVRLNQAYEVLSDPEQRERYDKTLQKKSAQPSTSFTSFDFVDGVQGEVNRRLAVLSLLYRKCRANIHNPQISLLELEAQMGVPREYLDFTIWYLRSKKLINQQDNAEFTLTSSGVDYIEENYEELPVLQKLLTAGTPFSRKSRSETETPAEEAVVGHLIN